VKLFPKFTLTCTLPLLLAACGGQSGTTQPPSTTSYVVSGTLYDLDSAATSQSQIFSGWTGGAGTVRALNGSSNLASGNVASSGSFSVNLPGTIPTTDLSGNYSTDVDLSTDDCVGTLAISNKAALTTSIAFEIQGTTQNGATLPVDIQITTKADGSGTIKEIFSLLFYSNATTSLTGRQTCIVKGVQVNTDFDIKLQPGYNVANLVINLAVNAQGTATGSASFSNGSRPSRWIVSSTSATPLSLKTHTRAIANLMQQKLKNLFH